jgi:hypothetical protein
LQIAHPYRAILQKSRDKLKRECFCVALFFCSPSCPFFPCSRRFLARTLPFALCPPPFHTFMNFPDGVFTYSSVSIFRD